MRPFLLAILLATTSVARAEDEDGDFVAMPKRSIGISLGAHATRIGGRSEGGVGPTLDLALGRGRWQYFGEAGFASSSMASWTASVYDTPITGRMAHGGLGVRWLARQFRDENKTGGFEMFLVAALGMERFYLDDGTRLSRPEVGLGFGMQGRLYKRPRIGTRMDIRLLFTPDSDEACRGRCMGEPGANTGFAFAMGFIW